MVRKKYKFIGILFLFGSVLFFLLFCYPSSFLEEKMIDTENVLLGVDSYYEDMEESYLGILEIPSISLKNSFYAINSPLNNVNKNIYVVSGSTMPEELYSNLILAAHSGFSRIAYFKHLDKLSIGDIAFVYFENKKYIYQLVSIYYEEKDGTITIHREERKNHLTLITCDKKNKNIQNVYIFKQIDIN